jgi:2-polyprenyl-3-methyl-5-hydroxy-6-metoxy-1,4-benzoquinol methylase
MTDPGEPAMLDLLDSPWLELYRQASWWIPSNHHVVDLGCGTGRFAEQLRRGGHDTYLGLDFSPAAVDECRRYVPEFDKDTGWHGEFQVADLREWESGDIPGNTVFTCLETLEHLEDDLDLVRRVPVGHVLVFSVPNYGGEAHLRTFQNVGDAWSRYGHLLEFLNWSRLGGEQYQIHLYRAVRRASW